MDLGLLQVTVYPLKPREPEYMRNNNQTRANRPGNMWHSMGTTRVRPALHNMSTCPYT